MFSKKKCPQCGNKVSKESKFCSECGFRLNKTETKEDYGMLGKNDIEQQINSPFNEIKLPAGFNMLVRSLTKSLEKQLKEMDRRIQPTQNKENKNINQKKFPGGGFSISISSFGNMPPKININQQNKPKKQRNNHHQNHNKKQKEPQRLSEENIKKLMTLPRQEPKTNIKRFSDKVIYEIEIPEVKSIEDISIAQLENSIEVKAIGKEKVYSKLIPINIPLRSQRLQKGKLILEFE